LRQTKPVIMKIEIIESKIQTQSSFPPVLFIHGTYHGAWCWAENFLPYFAEKGYAGKALSLRGHGKSDGLDGLRWTRISDYVDDVIGAVKTFSKPPVLIGHSLGGFVVQKYLERESAPEIKGVILLSSVPHYGIWKTMLRSALGHFFLFLQCLVTLRVYPLISTASLTREFFFSKNIPEALLQKYFSHMQDDSYLAMMDMLILNLPRPSKPSVPFLVTGAQKDAMILPAEVKATAQAYGAQFKIFQDMAHDMMLEAKWQSAADYIIDWMVQTFSS